VALSVGFKSVKNFYRAFTRLIGLSPGAFKALTNDEASRLHTKVKQRLLRIR
jgi:AraC-like DNA-binding protein